MSEHHDHELASAARLDGVEPVAGAPEGFDTPTSQSGEALVGRLDALDRKLDTIAGAMAAVARSQTELVAATAAHQADLGRALDVLTGLADALERSASRTDDRLASIRDAAAVPVSDLQALLTARTERTDHQLEALIARVDAVLTPAAAEDAGPGRGLIDVVDRLEDAVAALRAEPEASAWTAADQHESADVTGHLDGQVDEVRSSVRTMAWQLPELAEEVSALRERLDGLDVVGTVQATAEDLAEDLRNHTDTALAATLRVLDDRLHNLRSALAPVAPPAAAPGMGFEAGAVMGATQAAWNRLEQRLDADFDDLGRQLQAMVALVEQALATAEAAANRPVVTGDQLRKTATSVKDAVLSASRSRRDRRGGPRSLGSG